MIDTERLRDWWDSLSDLDQFNAYLIEKSNADALAQPAAPAEGRADECGKADHRIDVHAELAAGLGLPHPPRGCGSG